MAKKADLDPEGIMKSSQLTSLSKVFTTSAALLITIIGVRYIAQDLIAPILFALFYTVLMYPIFKWFRGKGFNSMGSLILMILTFFISLYLLRTFFTWSFGLVNSSLETQADSLKGSFNQAIKGLNLGSSAENAIQGLTPDSVNTFLSGVSNRLTGLIYYFVFIPILSFMILLQIDSLPQELSQKLLSENPGLRRLTSFAQSITLYVNNRFKVNLVTGLLFALCLILIGIDYPFVWGILTVILSFIPYIGVIIAGIPPAFLALSTGQPGLALLVFITLFIVDILAENILEPYIQGQSNKISMATVVISLIFWSWLLGFIGAIMATPLTVLLKTILADYPQTRWIAALMEGNYAASEVTSGKQNRVTKFLGKFLSGSNKT